MKSMEESIKCSFCNNSDMGNLNITTFDRFKEMGIIPKSSPYMCRNCFITYSRVHLLEEFLIHDDIKCTECGKEHTHFRILFNGNGHTAYCDCKSCHNEITITMSSYGHPKIEDKAQIQVAPSV